jgi:hypothetical protein
LPDSSKDCFARDKFADYRDDMGGVGTFTRQNRTLYVGRIKETGAGPETEVVVKRHFKEWGDIEHSARPHLPTTIGHHLELTSVSVPQYESSSIARLRLSPTSRSTMPSSPKKQWPANP